MADSAPITAQEALELLSCEGSAFHGLMARAGAVRERLSGNKVNLCAIINAKSGKCPEDCSFCAQSSHHQAEPPVYKMVTPDEILGRSHELRGTGVREYSIVTSGKRIRSDQEMAALLEAVARLKDEGAFFRCASLGILPREVLKELKKAGLTKYHHNLETARSFFPEICTTHDYEEDMATIEAALEIGLRVCAGGLFGLGESLAQRIELAVTLQGLGVHSVPVNFLNSIPGTPLEGKADLSPMDCLKIIAVYRLMMPDMDIYVCGGREKNLRDLQSWIFAAGANGMMVGNYLTTSGRDLDADLQMLADLGLEPRQGDYPCGRGTIHETGEPSMGQGDCP